jgi:hypothetical protein
MAVQLAVLTRNARLDAVDTEVGAAATLEIRSGAPPADCAAPDSGSVLCTITLPNPAFAAAGAGAIAKNGTWSGTATGDGVAGHFRIKAGGATTKIQGTVGEGVGDLSLDNTDIATDQTVTVTGFQFTDANA